MTAAQGDFAAITAMVPHTNINSAHRKMLPVRAVFIILSLEHL